MTSSPSIQWREQPVARPELTHVVFDFDGTLSWLRHGWPEFMADVMLEKWSRGIDRDALLGEILALNGKPSIFQCQRFCDLAQAQGAPGLEAEAIRAEFQARLDAAIAERMARIRGGEVSPEHYLIHGARAFLDQVAAAGLRMAILSTTTQHRVVEEAELLGIAHHFGKHIYGGTGDPLLFTKRAVFDRLLTEENCPGTRLLSFGDGPVEIHETKDLGGIAVAVCSDELHNGSGLYDPHKRRHLFEVGADAAIPDFRDAGQLLSQLTGR